MRRLRKARVNLSALDDATLRLQLFDDTWLTVSRTRDHRPASGKRVWVGRGPDGAQVVLTVASGVLTGTVFSDHRTFEVTIDADGQYIVAELDPAAFPTDDPIEPAQLEFLDPQVQGAAALPMAGAAATGMIQVDAMIVWTPNAEAAAGGRAAMESLALASVANANQVYANSGINAQLNLVYAAPVAYTETPSSIGADLGAIRSSSDGLIDQVHTLRTQYGADIVTLIGEGYRNAGACGVAYLMGTVSATFASAAFSVVDRTCAVGNLSYAHEIGHNQGLNHDAANASGAGAYSYAFGYQSPSGLFRTMMAYGSAVRIPFLSSPILSYSGLPTGTVNENNALALTNTISTVAAFKSPSGAPPTCTYSVSTMSIAFTAAGGSASVSVTAPSGCSWQAVNDAGANWVSLSTSGGSGSGTVTVSAAANSGAARSTSVTIAGRAIEVSEAAAVAPPANDGGINVAAASAGATASASSTLGSGYPAAGAINGDRRGTSWEQGGGWNDATPGSFPDWLQVDFAGAKTISDVRIFSVQDNYTSPIEPTATQTFSLYGVTTFTVQYWDGAQWLSVPGGTITGNQYVQRTITFPAVTTAKIRILITGAGDGYSRLTEVEAYEETGPVVPAGTNVAAASAGATASASTTYSSGFSPAGAINSDRTGTNWGAGGGWNDATPGGFPDWLQVDFAGPRTVSEVRVFSVQDNYPSPIEPTETQTFSLYGLTDFTVQYWDGAQWLIVPGGTITGNQHVRRTITFPALATSRIRIVITGARDGYSRLAEVEAYEGTGPVVPSGTNVAAASAGATASASSIYSNAYGPAGTINGDRKGTNWSMDGGWNDATPGSFPDWLQVDFAGNRTISEVRVFSVQDNYTSPIEPTATQTFSLYGVTNFAVQYWDGAQWLIVPGGTIAGNGYVQRTITFPAITTAKIRIVITGARDGYSRLTEVEAYQSATAPPPSGTTSVRLAWFPNPESDIAGYVLAWGKSPGVYTESLTVAKTATTQDVTTLAWATQYFFAIRAFNTAGMHSGYSNEVAVMTGP